MENKKPQFVMLVGLPAVGKSTIRATIAASLYDPVIISSDDIIERECSKVGITYNEGFKRFIKMATSEVTQLATQAVNDNRDVVWDQTNLTSKQRQQKMAVFSNYEKVAVVVQCSNQQEYEQRLNSRPGKNIPQNVINSMRANFQMPSETEGFDEVIVIDTSTIK